MQSNWANDDLATQRRQKFICALIAAIRKTPIYGPGGGNPIIGEEAKPLYTVAISNDLAQENMKKASDAKMKQRWDYESSDSDSDDDEKLSTKERSAARHAPQYNKEIGVDHIPATAAVINPPPRDNATITTRYDPYGPDSKQSRARSLRSNQSVESRRQDIETVRHELQRGTTRGRRKAGATATPAAVNPTTSGPPISTYPGDNQGFSNLYMQQGLAAAQVHFSPQQGPFPSTGVQYPQQPPASAGSESQRPPLLLSPPFLGPQVQYPPQPDDNEKLQ